VAQVTPAASVANTIDRELLRHRMPSAFGDNSNATLVEVTYAPGGSTRPHRHPCPVVGYVVEGALRMQMEGGAEHIYRAGDAFYEDPNDVHLVSANASSKTVARFVAFFACHDDVSLAPLPVTVVPPAASGGAHP
jgi:quercetin dioxygenase-like cupin family protein